MNNPSILDHLTLAYAPLLGRWREMAGVRLKLLPSGHQARPDAEGLLRALGEAWDNHGSAPQEAMASSGATPLPVLLDVTGSSWAERLLEQPLPGWVGLAMSATLAQDAALAERLRAARSAGTWIVARAPSWEQVPESLRDCFGDLLVESEGGGVAGARLGRNTWVEGARTLAEVNGFFEHGARGVVGWPREAEPAAGRDIRAEVPVVVDLMNRVERQEPLENLERALKTDPTLVFRLLRYINSAALGLRVEVTALRQALMLLGYLPLLRWLSRMLLDAAAKEGASRPLVHMSVRRGFLMERMGAVSGQSAEAPEMFLCGMFSLLDVLLQRPLGELVATLPLPERVRSSLLEPDGPYSLHLRWVEAAEGCSPSAIRDALGALRISPHVANLAVLQGLASARMLDG
jgi:EAL and modified HD-GYP domain-containing signal transduction protein